jgi:hypothetical protein
MEWFIGMLVIGSVYVARRVWVAAKPRPRWKVEQEEWLRDEGYFGGADAGEQAAAQRSRDTSEAWANSWEYFD